MTEKKLKTADNFDCSRPVQEPRDWKGKTLEFDADNNDFDNPEADTLEEEVREDSASNEVDSNKSVSVQMYT